jgi:hypothetical protein
MARIISYNDDWIEIRDDGDELVFAGHRPPETIYQFAEVIKAVYGKVIETEEIYTEEE